MLKTRIFAAGCALLCALGLLSPPLARADGIEANALRTGLVDPASAALQRLQAETDAPQVLAQANPIGLPQQPLRKPGLPLGLSYTLDLSMTFPYGDPGYNAGLPGGLDAVVGYGFSRNSRVQVGYYELPEAPIGFTGATVPLYVQGLPNPIATTKLAIDPTIKNKFLTIVDQQLITLFGKLPIVISPSYLARWGTVGGGSDQLQIEYNGFPTTVRLRTAQSYLLALTVPFLSSPRMFGTYTISPQWLVHPAGVNQTNHAQLFQLLYLEYRASKQTTFFFQPSMLVDYLPSDPYPEHVPTWIVGASYKFTKLTFVQLDSLWGGATNRSPYGITSVTCQSLPCTNVAPSLGGLHSAEIQLEFGIGSPSVIPL
ncbi:MAG: hypothetical protein WAJ85_10335 [Candidatus Baltobacteraceae bacterium]|jgi:hypothetical protein